MNNQEIIDEIKNHIDLNGETFERMLLVEPNSKRIEELDDLAIGIKNYIHKNDELAINFYKRVFKTVKTPGELLYVFQTIGMFIAEKALTGR